MFINYSLTISKIGSYYSYILLFRIVRVYLSKATQNKKIPRNHKAKMNKFHHSKYKTFQHSKIKTAVNQLDKYFDINVKHNGLISLVYTEFLPIKKKVSNPVEKRAKDMKCHNIKVI